MAPVTAADGLERAPVIARVVRDGAVESVHRGLVAVADASGGLLAALGDASTIVYPRSVLKPFQAAAIVDLLAAAGDVLAPRSLAIATASHLADDDQLIEAAHVLALADLDESALRCPPDLPARPGTDMTPAPLAHTCSGKHAGFLLAQRSAGGDPGVYLDSGSVVQRRAAEWIEQCTGATPAGPGVDGCGAPAWRVPLAGVAAAFAKLAAAEAGPLAAVGAAMRAHPELVGGDGCEDTQLMRADHRVLAKRGADGVQAAALATPSGALGVAVKAADGGQRAAAAALGTVLRALGAVVDERVARPVVLGGGQPHGAVEADATLRDLRA